MSPALSFEKRKKTKQYWGLRVANDILFNQVGECMHSMLWANSGLWGLFPSTSLQLHCQQYFRKCVPGLYYRMQDQILLLPRKSNFLSFLRHSNCFKNHSRGFVAHDFNIIRNGTVQAGLQGIKLWQSWKFFIKVTWAYLLRIWYFDGYYFQNRNLPLTFQIHLLRKLFVKKSECNDWDKLCICIGNQLYCKRYHC